MQKAGLVVAVVLAAALSGCLQAFSGKHKEAPGAVKPAEVGYDPSQVAVNGFEKSMVTIPSFDSTPLSTIIYAPTSSDTLPDGSPPRWGVVAFLHGWGDFKEMYEGAGGATGAPAPADPSSQAPYSVNRLEAFARAGLIAVAYDARGFGQSGGMATVAGPAEMADLDAVLDYVAAHYPTNGLVGLVGQSYGGGEAYQAIAGDPRITTIAPFYGWVDLYQGLLPGNVPKAEWTALLLGIGEVGGKAQVSPMVYDWLQKASTRTDLETVHAQMDARSALGRLAAVPKPILVCQGMQETLFPQADLAWGQAAGFTRATIVTGGHGSDPPLCWSRALDWMQYFVAGKDTKVDAWPALTTVDASGLGEPLSYPTFPASTAQTSYLRSGSPGALVGDPANTTFTIQQSLVGNPLEEPSGLWDAAGQPNNQAPEQFRQDPSGALFASPKSGGSEVLLGAPVVHLHLAAAPPAPPRFQVVAELFHVDAYGKSTLLSRGAHAVLSPADLAGGSLTVRLDWTKADLSPGDTLELKVGGNDQAVYMPLPADYAVTFDGYSSIDLPYFSG
jgi:predicted acyl esterase